MMGAQGGAAPASQGTGATHGATGGESGQRQGGDGGDVGGFDPKEAFKELRSTRDSLKKVSSDFDSYRKDSESERQVLKRLKEALAPEQKQKRDPVQDLNSEWAELQEVFKSNDGKMPMTERLAKRVYQEIPALHAELASMRKELAAMKQGVDRANDPATPVNQMAYSQMENHIQQSLDQMYGSAPETAKARKLVYEAVTSSLVSDLQELQQKAPDRWDQLRRNPGELQKVVTNALRGIVPPKAMEMVDQDRLRNTEMGRGELMGAWRELRAVRDKTADPAKRKMLNAEMVKIRQQIAGQEMAPAARSLRRQR